MKQLILLSILIGLFVGCAGSHKKGSEASDNATSGPAWFLNPPKEDGYLFGVGVSDVVNLQLRKESADSRARKEIAKVLSSRVASLLEDHLKQMGETGNGEVATQVVESATRSLTQMDFAGCPIERRFQKEEKIYSLARCPSNPDLRDAILGKVKRSIATEEALYSEFQAKEGFKKLEKELEKSLQAGL